MALYTSVRGWVNYHGESQGEAIRRAIAVAAERAPERVEPHDDRAFAERYAADIAAGWRFIAESLGWGGASLAVWSGVIRNYELFLLRDQVEAIATVLRPEHDYRPDGQLGYWLQGLFDVRVDEGPALEWRLYNGTLHENERPIPRASEETG